MTRKRKLLLGCLLVLGAAQIFQPGRTNPPVSSDFIAAAAPPPAVAQMLRAACYDCHSNETLYPWYAYIVPVGNWIQGHVRHGREHLNFSTWGDYPPDKQAHLLEESAEELEKKKMPLGSYTWTHAGARLAEDERRTLIDWLNAASAH